MDAAARERFDALVDRLRGSMLDRMSQGLADAVKGMKPEDLAAQRAMVQDLNRLLAKRLSGDEPSRGEVDEFLAQHGAFFPGAATLDDVVEQLAERMAAMQSLLRSLTPEQRAELQDTIDALLRDDRLQLGPRPARREPRPAAARRAGRPGAVRRRPAAGPRVGAGAARPAPGAGPPGGRPRGRRRRRRPRRHRPRRRSATCSGRTRHATSTRSRTWRTAWSRRATSIATAIAWSSRPRGSRRIGQKVLDDLFARLRRDAFGGHRLDRTGRGGDREETPKPFEFGDPFHLDLRATMSNALMREENAPSRRPEGPGRPPPRPTTSRSSGPSGRRRRRPSCSST